jgi:hypothetical protein
MMYYVARDGQQYGPYSADTVRQYLAAGSLLASDMAREESGQSWLPLGQYFPPVAVVAPVAPQYTSGPAYGGPAYGQAGHGAQGVQPLGAMVGQPIVPPDLHWALVLLLSMTGVFTFVWALIQASYARKIDPGSKATVYYVLWLVGSIVNFLLYVGLIVQIINNNGQPDDSSNALGAIIFLLGVGSAVFFVLGSFSISTSMQRYYNSREPIQLRLNGVMVFFFSILYLQYHMSRIAAWKKTGYLPA